MAHNMRFFWNMVTGDLVRTGDRHIIALLLGAGYIEVSKEQFDEIAKGMVECGT